MVLRKSSGINRVKNNYKFIRSKHLYKQTKTNRIDRKLIERNLKFIEKVRENLEDTTSNIIVTNDHEIESNKYKPINYYEYLKNKNRLYTDKKLLIYNKRNNNLGLQIYVTDQNNEEDKCN